MDPARSSVRRRARLGPGAQNLDSFLDIMTNTVGVLIFVLLFVSLSAADAAVLVRTPLRQETKKAPLFFEVRGERVVHIDTKKVNGELERLFARVRALDPEYMAEVGTEAIEGFETTTENYRVHMMGSLSYESLNLQYLPRSRDAGEVTGQLSDTGSKYSSLLRRQDPNQAYVAFIVRPDGFEAFREARKLAWARGFQVGWEPFGEELPLSFVVSGKGGRMVGVQ
jgi:hypothetical protein